MKIAFGICVVFLLLLSVRSQVAADDQDLSVGHPRPSYSKYSDKQILELAEVVRKSRPKMRRGGWEWDRLLSRYIDRGRTERNELIILKAYLVSILDRYQDAKKEGKGGTFTIFEGHRSWGSGGRLRIFAELVRQDMLSEQEQAEFINIVDQSLLADFPDYANVERGVNNRPYGINSGPAIAVKMFPKLASSDRHRPWLNALWSELTEYGDTTETNYYPYGPLYLHGLLDMAEGMDKFKTERDFLHAHARRYLDYVHGGGVRGNPNSGSAVNQQNRSKIYSDPWNAEYYGGAESVNDGHMWYRFAKHYKDPEFLWASEQVLLGGRPPKGIELPAEYIKAYNERYFWFNEQGIVPKVPAGKSKIGYYSPLKHKVPERIYLGPGRQSGKPFVSYYIYDRNNNYMHYCDDADGRLYEYCVDGAKFLHTSGKYSSGRAGVGETAYDMLSVLPPDMDFPLTQEGKMSDTSSDSWKLASMAIKLALNCRTGPDSKNWYFDDQIQLFRRRNDPTLGYAHGNMDGYWYLNNDYHLTSVSMGEFRDGALLQNLRIAGPKGEKILAAFDSVPDNLKVVLVRGEEQKELVGNDRLQVLAIVEGGRRPGESLQVKLPEDQRVMLSIEGLNEKFDAQNEYTRVSYDFKAKQAVLQLNGRTTPIYYRPMYNRGAILVRDSLKAENQGDDSFGQFTFRNYYGARSRWTRQTVLTHEGIMVVRDKFEPGPDVDGYQAAACWLIKAEGPIKSSNRNWFDAPARDHAWWQTQKKRVLLYLHPDKDLKIGQVYHHSSQDIKSGPSQNTFAKATLKQGKTQLWLSVFVPFNEGEDATKIAGQIRTQSDEAGNANVQIGNQRIKIADDAAWQVSR